MKIKLAVALLLGASVSVGLVGCSSDAKPVKPSSQPSSESVGEAGKLPEKPGQAYELENKVDVDCVDGKAVIDAANSESTVSGPCDTVTISETGGWSIVHLAGQVENLVVDANYVGVYAKDLGTVTLNGKSNDVTHTGSAPKVRDLGENNRVSPGE